MTDAGARELHGAAEMPTAAALDVVEASLWLVAAQLVVWVLPFRWVAGFLGRTGHETPDEASPDVRRQALALHVAIRAVFRALGRRPLCLARSVAAMAMLRRRRLPATCYVGTLMTDHGLQGHAWVRCGDVYIVGGRARHRFQRLHSFATGE